MDFTPRVFETRMSASSITPALIESIAYIEEYVEYGDVLNKNLLLDKYRDGS